MTLKKQNWSRRKFLKTVGVAGVGSILSPAQRLLAASGELETIPTRSFGKTGEQVSILSMGGIIDFLSNQLLLKQALNRGITY